MAPKTQVLLYENEDFERRSAFEKKGEDLKREYLTLVSQRIF